jgi:hypothetical protein
MPSPTSRRCVVINGAPAHRDQTRVRFDVIVDLAAPIPEFLITRAKKIVLDTAIDRLRCRVTRNHG